MSHAFDSYPGLFAKKHYRQIKFLKTIDLLTLKLDSNYQRLLFCVGLLLCFSSD